jgi:CubicO group peptidase (beta-lactamase class C family)
MKYKMDSGELDKRLKQFIPYLSNQVQYAQRVLGSQRIQPITQSNWYQPREIVLGNPVDQPAFLPLTDQFPLSGQGWQAIDQYLLKHQTRAFLVLWKGQLVHQFYHQFKPHYQFNSMSMLKTLVALMVGIAIDQGLIADVHVKAAEFLPEWQHDQRRAISIEHLLSMQSGLKSDVKVDAKTWVLPIIPLYLGDEIERTALALPAVAPPGRYFEYNNYNTQLLGIILQRASGLSAAQFLSKYVWQPLHCHSGFLWLDKPNGQARTFGAFFAQAEDWLRVGQLFINRGRFQGQQIVSEQWLDDMQVPRNTPARGVMDGRADYGYQLWLKAHDYGLIRGIPWYEATHATTAFADDELVYFEGLRGQCLFIHPRHDLVVLRMGERPKKDWDMSWMINQLCQALP